MIWLLNAWLPESSIDWGNATELAINGREAVEAWRNGEFDVIFMDMQMPVMDGLAATRQIRKEQAENGIDKHIPIVAITAAEIVDRQRCLKAGMDDFINKPITPPEIQRVLNLLFGSKSGCDDNRSNSRSEDASNNRILANAHKQLGACSNRALAELFEMMVEEGPSIVTEIEKSLKEKNAESIALSAHKLKGTFGFVGAETLIKIAEQIEGSGELGQFDVVGNHLVSLRSEVGNLCHELRDLVIKLK